MHFIRCILPNHDKKNGKFEEELVLNQLNTSCTVSYANFIRFGYSKSVAFEEFVEKCRSVEEKWTKGNADRASFYSKVLLSIGFKNNECKMGNEAIFLRSNKFVLLEKFFVDMETFSATERRREPK